MARSTHGKIKDSFELASCVSGHHIIIPDISADIHFMLYIRVK